MQNTIQSVIQYLNSLNRLMDPDEVAKVLSVTRGQLQSWRIHGLVDLPFINCGPRYIRYDPAEIAKFLLKQTAGNTGEVKRGKRRA